MKSALLKKSTANKKQGNKSNQHAPKNTIEFIINSKYFNENYIPSSNTRATTNFANLARGENRQENLRNTIQMIDHRFNSLATWDNPNCNRYSVELEIISVDIDIEGNGTAFPSIEILKTHINATTPPPKRVPKIPLSISIFRASVIFQITKTIAIPITIFMATVPFNNL